MKKNMLALGSLILLFTSCDKGMGEGIPVTKSKTITIENVLNGRPLVESGTFKGVGDPPVILPGDEVSFSFYAAKGQYLTFATMYGFSNDLFFAPENPGIRLYNDDGSPITGDVSAQVKLWDNGTRVNQTPGAGTMHPGTAESSPKNITAVNGMDDYGNQYLAASDLMQVTLEYEAEGKFKIILKNVSGGTTNETPFSPGVWAVSYVAGGELLMPNPIYTAGQPTMNGLTNLSEMGDITVLNDYLSNHTGAFTPFSPVLVVVYRGDNPFYKSGEEDRMEGLKDLAQTGNAEILAASLRKKSRVQAVHILQDAANTVLLPRVSGASGGKVSQKLSLAPGDRIAIATMYGFSNDWFFATKGRDIDGDQSGDMSSLLGLFDNGTAVSEFPGAGLHQANLSGTPVQEQQAIQEVPLDNGFNTLPMVTDMIKVTLE